MILCFCIQILDKSWEHRDISLQSIRKPMRVPGKIHPREIGICRLTIKKSRPARESGRPVKHAYSGYGYVVTVAGVELVGVIGPVVLITLVIIPTLPSETVDRLCHLTPATFGASKARAETTAGLTLK